MRRTIALLAASAMLVVLLAAPAGAKTPRSCKRALVAADQVIDISSRLATTVGTFFGSMSDAANQGASDGDITAFLQSLNDATTTLRSTISGLNTELTPVIMTYRANELKCKAGR